MLGERLGECSGKFTSIRVLPSEGEHIWLEVAFQGKGTLLGREITDTGTYRQTFRPGGVLKGEGHVLMITDSGDVADWVGGGVGRQTGPGYQASFGVSGSCTSATGALSRLAEVADVIEYEVEEDAATAGPCGRGRVPASRRSRARRPGAKRWRDRSGVGVT